MLIVDSQVHIWAANTPERPWPARHKAHRPQPITKDDLLNEMDAAGVDRAVLVPPSWEGERNDLVLAAAQAHPDRFAVMGRFDAEAADARAMIPRWLDQPGMLGLRFTFHRESLRPLLLEGKVDWLWSQAAKFGVPIMVLTLPQDLHMIGNVAQQYPDLRLTIDHLALARGTDDVAFAEFDRLLALAKHPNVAVKATCLPHYTTDSYPYRWLHPYIKRVYDSFGPRRMFWGSDISRLPCTLRQGVTMFTEEMTWLSTDDLEWIMGRGVCNWLDWKI